jgi:Mrp family chromosome partitioning ATPase
MSKNFELLQRVAKAEFFGVPESPAPPANQARIAIPFKKDPPDAEIAGLVQRLFSAGGQGYGPKVVSFSGMAREDRSSWICAKVGEALAAQADVSVCLVDANLRSPQLHVHLGAANRMGLAEALTQHGPIRNFVMPLGGRNLWLIPGGHAQPGLYASPERLRECCAELRAAFGYILISAPSLDHKTEATLMGQLADGIVLIVEAHRSRRETVRRAKEQLESARVLLLGAVLDQRRFPIPEKLYRKL